MVGQQAARRAAGVILEMVKVRRCNNDIIPLTDQSNFRRERLPVEPY